MSRDRHFKLVSVQRSDAGPRQSAAEISCGCGAIGHVVNTSPHKVLPAGIVAKKFEQKGWVVGASTAGDRCPACVARLQERRAAGAVPDLSGFRDLARRVGLGEPSKAATRAEATAAFDAWKAAKDQQAAEAVMSTEAEKPKEMGVEDRRLIIAKINEVYVGEDVGYSSGWSDKRVADDLGCPRAWVAEVRDYAFGPARDNEDVRALVAEVKALRETGEALERSAAEVTDRLVEVRGQIKALGKKADAVLKAVS